MSGSLVHSGLGSEEALDHARPQEKTVWGETAPAGIVLRPGFCLDSTPCLPTRGTAGGRELRTTFPIMQPRGG